MAWGSNSLGNGQQFMCGTRPKQAVLGAFRLDFMCFDMLLAVAGGWGGWGWVGGGLDMTVAYGDMGELCGCVCNIDAKG